MTDMEILPSMMPTLGGHEEDDMLNILLDNGIKSESSMFNMNLNMFGMGSGGMGNPLMNSNGSVGSLLGLTPPGILSNGLNAAMSSGMGSGMGSGMMSGMSSGSSGSSSANLPTLLISPANSTSSSPSLSSHLSSGRPHARARDNSNSMGSLEDTNSLGLSPNSIANFLGPPGSRTSAGSDNGSMMSSPTLVISPTTSLSQVPNLPPLSQPISPTQAAASPGGSCSPPPNIDKNGNKKRKRPKTTPDKSEVISNWVPYFPTNQESYNLYNEQQLDIMNTFDMDVKIDSGNAVYVVEDGGWIFYRQNQFQVTTELVGSLSGYTSKGAVVPQTNKKGVHSPQGAPTPMSTGECPLYVDVAGYLRKVESLNMDVRIIKQSRANLLAGIIDEENDEKGEGGKVKIFQVGASRTKKENRSVVPCQFVGGKAVQAKLQFQSATLNNARMQPGVPNPNQQYFRIVVSLLGKVVGSQEIYYIMSKVSPPIIVRGQSPGRYPHQQDGASTTVTGWKTEAVNDNEVTYFNGNVGINVERPTEALTVNGNILVTGNLVKPSDIRLKSDITEVSPAKQLDNIEKLKIYDYEIVNPIAPGKRHERGVLAQEVREVIPEAVHVLGDVTLADNTHVPDLLVVNDHVLLLENIGATKHLGELLRGEQDNIREIDSQLKDLEASTEESENVITTKLLSVLDYIASEEALENQRHCYCSFFGLGPAWSLFLLGYVFFGITWLFGIFYICSTNHVKRVAGVANLCMAVVLVTICILVGLYPSWEIVIYSLAGLVSVGALCMLIMSLYGRRRSLERQAALRQIKNILIQRYAKATQTTPTKYEGKAKKNGYHHGDKAFVKNQTESTESTPLLVRQNDIDIV